MLGQSAALCCSDTKVFALHPSEGLSCKDYSTVLVVCFLGDGRAGHKGDLPHEHLRLQ